MSFGVKLERNLVRIPCPVDGVRLQHALEVFLKVQYSLQALGSAVADGVTLRRGAERPSTLALVPVILSRVHGIAFNLRLIQPLEGLHAAGAVRLLSSKSRLDDSLGNEGDIPQLTPVRPGHHHPFFRKPHEIGSSSPMLLESNALGTVDVPPNYEIHHLVDGT